MIRLFTLTNALRRLVAYRKKRESKWKYRCIFNSALLRDSGNEAAISCQQFRNFNNEYGSTSDAFGVT